MKAFAAKSPDRWAQGVAILTRAAGFMERTEVTGAAGLLGFVRRLERLSDSELTAEVERLSAARSVTTTSRNGAPRT